MTHIFYFLLTIPLLYELYIMNNPRKFNNFKTNFINRDKSKKLTDNQALFVLVTLTYLLLTLLGLFSFQWILFLVILLMSLMPKKYSIIICLDAFITVTILLFIIINKYHLHINITDIVWKKLNYII